MSIISGKELDCSSHFLSKNSRYSHITPIAFSSLGSPSRIQFTKVKFRMLTPTETSQDHTLQLTRYRHNSFCFACCLRYKQFLILPLEHSKRKIYKEKAIFPWLHFENESMRH